MFTTATGSLLENTRIITRLENAQIRARLENAKIIARLIRERGKSKPVIIPRTGPPSLKPPPAGLRAIEQAQTIKALRSGIELLRAGGTSEIESEFPIVRQIQNRLRGVEETQSLDRDQSRGVLIDRLI
ncbi:MAG: hypothetical protein JRI85_06690 [Deltaproteobacteria bacterium]|nr:hypothetical protein [Deltaproteobacteria bacterium]